MRVALDTNILLSALMVRGTAPGRLYEEWRHGSYDLVSSALQLDELQRISSRQFFLGRIKPSEIGRMIHDIRRLAVMCVPKNSSTTPSAPGDEFLLALSVGAEADYLVTGDESGLLSLKRHGGTLIVTAREMVAFLDVSIGA